VNQRGQEPVDKDEFVFGTSTDSSPTRSRSECRLVPFLPQRADHLYKFGDHLRVQSGDLSTTGDRCTRPVPHHTNHDR
ncbi:hypothetical protein ACWD0A_34830, partial [Streptomyces sp. NPDC002867]